MSIGGRKDAASFPPEVIADRYIVERLLGRGGMATVYLCMDSAAGNRVAVKILRKEIGSAVIVDRFLREIDLASKLDHPRIPKVLDSGVIGDLPFYVMTYIEGESLRARLDREKQLPIPDVVRIATEVIEPLAHAHANGIVHRDVKPENILLSPEGVYLLDLGVARAIIESAGDRLTSTGIAVGTPTYMSPEQALSDKGLDARSDIYSLGCVTYEMIAGIPPFVGATAQAVLSRRFVASPPPLLEAREGVSDQLQHAVGKALMRAPSDRWQTAAEFGSALTSSERLRSSKFATIARTLRHRKRMLASIIAIPVFLGAGFAIAVAIGLVPRSLQRPDAVDPRRIAVLYFDDHSDGQTLGYLANGLTESLIHELGVVRGIQVVSRNGVKPYRDRATPIDSIVAALRVGSLVEGSVERSGDRVRVRVQMIDAKTETPVESATIEREKEELFKLEDDLGREVASMLRKRIGKEIRVRETIAATSSSRARELVFRAEEARDDAALLLAGNDSSEIATGMNSLVTADSLLADAERADPKWIGPIIGRGWLALDAARRQSDADRDRSFRRASDHAQRAVSQNPTAPAALELRGTIMYYKAARLPLGDAQIDEFLRLASKDLRKAVEGDSTLATAWATLGRTQLMQGSLDSAVRSAKIALRTDAYLTDAADVMVVLYGATVMRDSLDAAWQWCLRGREEYPRDPRFVECQLTLLVSDVRRAPDPKKAWSLVREGNRLDPPREARKRGRPFLPFYRVMLAAEVSARAGDRDSARVVAARTRAAVSNDTELALDVMYQDAYISLLLGDTADAKNKLIAYHAARPSVAHLTLQHARWKPLFTDTAFANRLRRAKAR